MDGWVRRLARTSTLAGAGIVLHAAVLASQQRPTLCGGESVSRWSTAGTSYVQGSVAGTTPATELESITGLVATGRRVYVHEGTVGRIHVLSDQLQPVFQFGRLGGGPGEFAPLPMLGRHPLAPYTSNTLAADDSLLYVYDGRRLQQYSHDGKYVDSPSSIPGPFHELRFRKLEARREGLYYGYDSLNFIRGDRQLQTWRTSPDGKMLVHSVKLPPQPVANGSAAGWGRDPRPIWTMSGGCVIWSDGFNHRLVRTRLHDGATDTVQLPAHKVPPSEYDHATATQLALSMGSPPPPRRSRNAPLWHWAGLVVDPDGHTWVRPWTASGRPEGHVYRVDPWGRVYEERVPAFPEAFGLPGVFYSRDRHRQTDELLLVRYQKGK